MNVLVYLLRRDLRVSDNPVLHHLASSDHDFTHLLPVYVFPANQVEVSGFIESGGKSPYPEARSQVGRYWRCGPHRAKFIAEAVWKVKESYESLGSGLVLRVGSIGDVVETLLEGLHGQQQHTVGAVWIASEEGVEEKQDERAVATVCKARGIDYKVWVDEKYFIDDRDLKFDNPNDLPDVFTTYRKSVEPLRECPRAVLPKPAKSSLPPLPDSSTVPSQSSPFFIPETYAELEKALVGPVKDFLPNIPPFPEKVTSAHPFKGGEEAALDRLDHLIKSGALAEYKATRNGLLGTEFSTKLSAYLAQGCITARQIHAIMGRYEHGTDSTYENAKGYGEGENEGTAAVRFELLWRDYMRLCTKKFKHKLFRLRGFRGDEKYEVGIEGEGEGEGESQGEGTHPQKNIKWKSADPEHALPTQHPAPAEVAKILERFNAGTTGMGLIDAAQRELMHTGYTSNRARQNVASFLAKHLEIDWRYGAEWYEMLLIDYDVSSNWANWQYVAGVGNDPRGEARIFNPVKQAWDYDKDGDFVRGWVPEVAGLERRENVFQAWTAPSDELERHGLSNHEMVTDPVKKIDFSVEGKPRTSKRPFIRRRGNNNNNPGPSYDPNRRRSSTADAPFPYVPPPGPVRADGSYHAGSVQYGQQGEYQGPPHGNPGFQGPPGGRGRGSGGYRGRFPSNRGGYASRGRFMGGPPTAPRSWGGHQGGGTGGNAPGGALSGPPVDLSQQRQRVRGFSRAGGAPRCTTHQRGL